LSSLAGVCTIFDLWLLDFETWEFLWGTIDDRPCRLITLPSLLGNLCSMRLFGNSEPKPTPYRVGGPGGDKPNHPGIVIQSLEWNCKVTFLNKPWALVRKYFWS
jgi:hypothetical protein